MSLAMQNTVPDFKDSGKGKPPTIYRHIFGPVPSRRLGLSLGVDLMPHKTCSLDCVYCECGRTTHLTITPEEYVPVASVKEELVSFLSSAPRLDFITFSGSGEPTLHSGIGEVADFIKSNFPQYKLALLTNGTLLSREDVRRRLLAIDVVIVSVDGGGSEAFRKVNRPHPGLSLSEMEAGLISFRKIYKNSLWAEVFLVPGCNTSHEELARIREMLKRIQPDKVQVNTLDRPGAESWVMPLEKDELERAASFLQAAEMISSSRGSQVREESDDLADRILAAIRRRPLTIDDICRMMGVAASEALEQLEKMEQEKIVTRNTMPRGIFFMAGQR